MSNKNGLLKSILPWVVLLFLIGGLVTYMNQGNSKEIKYSEFVEVVQDEKIKEVEIVPSSLVVDVSGNQQSMNLQLRFLILKLKCNH